MSATVPDLGRCARWHGADMRLCACRLADGWAECPPAARGVLRIAKPNGAGAVPGGFTGDMCDQCGSMQVVRTGTCGTCIDCGTTTGGCS